jgi:hypothetical protein
VTPDERVTALYDLAENWTQNLRLVRTVAACLPHTTARSAFDYVLEARDVLADARALREVGHRHDLVAKYLDDVDLRDLTETQQYTAALETAECVARDVLVRAVTRDDELAAQSEVAA